MSAAHTPGPWRQLSGNSRARIVTVEKQHVVADVNSYNVDMDANARLIAAAPELLAALQDLLCTYGNDLPEHKPEDDAARMARIAIAKATGSKR